jgi:hypothetical protein
MFLALLLSLIPFFISYSSSMKLLTLPEFSRRTSLTHRSVRFFRRRFLLQPRRERQKMKLFSSHYATIPALSLKNL